jgi:chromosome segregation ATPase
MNDEQKNYEPTLDADYEAYANSLNEHKKEIATLKEKVKNYKQVLAKKDEEILGLENIHDAEKNRRIRAEDGLLRQQKVSNNSSPKLENQEEKFVRLFNDAFSHYKKK